jgi:hypothetical protein
MPKMGVNPEDTKLAKPVPADWYELRLKGLKCQKSPKGYNYVAYLNVVNNKSEYNDAFVMFRMNNGFMQAKAANDFCHGLGFPLEQDGSFPGDWKLKDPSKPDEEFDGAEYTGVLLGKTLRAELFVDNYEGIDRNAVRQIACKVPNCSTQFPDIRHMTDLVGKKK